MLTKREFEQIKTALNISMSMQVNGVGVIGVDNVVALISSYVEGSYYYDDKKHTANLSTTVTEEKNEDN